jgi:hypothetical protein
METWHGVMMDTTRRRLHGWLGTLLLLAQLAAGVLLPLVHGAEAHHGDVAQHVEAGSDAGCHSAAVCPVCRMADTRVLPGLAPVAATWTPAIPSADAVSSPAGLPARTLLLTAPPRGPPA